MATGHVPRVRYGEGDSSVLLVLEGRVHYLAAKSLRAFADELTSRMRNETLVIDLTAVDAIDSTGMGLLARLGRKTLARGRRSVLVCPDNDVLICLRSASFDKLFVVLDESPLDEPIELREVPLDAGNIEPEALGAIMLQAHRDLAMLSEENQRAFADVIALLAPDSARSERR
jgi:anti-anti-sigma factor